MVSCNHDTMMCYSSPVEQIDLITFLAIVERVTNLTIEQCLHGACNLRGAEAALAAPFAGIADQEFFPAPHEKAAILCSRIVRHHPLPDGNKRAGYVTMRYFLVLNGFEWRDGRGGKDETTRAIEMLAANTLDETRFINWIAHRMYDEP
jgi:death on curing protein